MISQLTGKKMQLEDLALTEFEDAASGKEADLIYDVDDKNLGEEAADKISKHYPIRTSCRSYIFIITTLK